MQDPEDQRLRKRAPETVSQRVAQVREEIASLEGVLEGFPTAEQSAQAQKLVGHLRNTAVRNALWAHQKLLADLTREMDALAVDAVETSTGTTTPPEETRSVHAVALGDSVGRQTSDPSLAETVTLESSDGTGSVTLPLAYEAIAPKYPRKV